MLARPGDQRISWSPSCACLHLGGACPLLPLLPPPPSRLTSSSNRPGHKINKHLLFIRKIIKLQKNKLKNQGQCPLAERKQTHS